jgi:hypothetical protein
MDGHQTGGVANHHHTKGASMTDSQHAAEYVAARTVLLDALDVLIEHRAALIVVGAQAVYARTGGAGLVTAPYTDDGDLAIDVTRLAARPGLEQLMTDAHFRLKTTEAGGGGFQPGQWERDVIVDGQTYTPQVDLIVPRDTLPGRRDQRGARLADHGARAAMRTHGLEAAVVDNDPMVFTGVAHGDDRSLRINVAGAAALTVAKIHKIGDRLADTARPDRQTDKDAADLYRLIRATPIGVMIERLSFLRGNPTSGATVIEALDQLPELFGRPRSPGVQMAVRAAATDVGEATVIAQLTNYTQALITGVGSTP